jgi:hypothetical protein
LGSEGEKMKKYLVLVLSLLLVFGFAASAFAVHAEIPSETQAVVAKGTTQITLGGELRFRGWWTDNITKSGTNFLPFSSSEIGDNDSTDSWYDSRVRLSIQADVTKNTTGFVQLETSTESGGTLGRTSDTYTWGSMNQKPPAGFTILQAWIQHKGSGLLGVPAAIKVGHMPIALGHKIFLDHTKFGDDAIALSIEPTKDLLIDIVTAKWAEGDITVAGDDADAYHLIASYAVDKDNKIGFDWTWKHSTNTASGNEGANFHNIGLNAKGNISGLSYAAEVDFQFGKVDRGTPPAEHKFRGYGIFLDLGYKLDPVNIRAGFAYGSGDSDLSDDKIKEFQTTMGRDVHYTFVYEYTLTTAALDQVVDPRTRNTSIANTTYYRLGLDYSPVKDLRTSLDGFIIRASRTPSGISKNVGWEIDLKAAYKIDRNLTYSIIAGVFKPGKFYEDKYLDNLGVDKKTASQFVHALTLSF